MKITDAPVDMRNATLKQAVWWLSDNHKYITNLAGMAPFNQDFGNSTWGMPDYLFNALSQEQIMWIQENTHDWLNDVTLAACCNVDSVLAPIFIPVGFKLDIEENLIALMEEVSLPS